MNTTITRALTAGLAVALAVGGVAVANAAKPGGSPAELTGGHGSRDTALVRDLSVVDRDTKWQLTSKLKLNFPTFHTEGIAFAGDRVFLSAVEIIEPTVKYPVPVGGYDRTPGKGIGHLFVLDRQGHLQKDIVLGEGDMYHPGGIDFDGENVWVPVAQYRPNSSAIIYRVDAASLRVRRQFQVNDHFGGIVLDKTTGHLVGNTWGSRRFVEWTRGGHQVDTWPNTSFFIDYQDCQYVPSGKMLCAGVTNLPQTPSAGGTAATYELGGLALIDLRTRHVLREVPFQQWSTAGHVATRNPVKVAADGNELTMWAAPDNGDEGSGTEILTYRATVTPPR